VSPSSIPLLFLSALFVQSSSLAAPSIGSKIDDFQLEDVQGRVHRLSDWRDGKLMVVAFLGTECPLAHLYGPRLADLARTLEPRGVQFLGIDPNREDSPSAIADYARTSRIPFPILKDADNAVADRFGATRTPEVFVLDTERRLRYRGRIDDQYGVGMHRAKPTRADLAIAVEELLAGQPVRQAMTVAAGCVIDRVRRPVSTGAVTYTRDIAPLLQKHCLACHRPGQMAPFALTNYKRAAAWAKTILEVVDDGRMPPWHANPSYGRFANEARLTEPDKQLLHAWVRGGCPEGYAADLPPRPACSDVWRIPKPDVVVSMPQPFAVPAAGVLEYQIIEVDPGFTEDKWIRAAEIRPGNRKVVHHCNVFVDAPGGERRSVPGRLGSYCLAATAPGTPPLVLPEGMAKYFPAGWHLTFVLHYTPVGTVQQDQTSIGLTFADPKTVRKEVATTLLYDRELCIPPHAADHRVEKSWQAPADILLLALFPHMHLRGKSFRYEALYPDGTAEILLDVPRYDFNWQNRYVLAEPKQLPAGTTVRCTAHYDNSAANAANPDPEATVRTGTQSWDEMFNGYLDWTLASQDLTRPTSWGVGLAAKLRSALQPELALLGIPAGGWWLLVQRYRRRRELNGTCKA
jgi:peroxiredoxin